MPVPISDRLFMDYLQCKYKAYLKFSGKIGVKSDFEIYQDDKNADYRQRAREHLLRAERNTKSFILTGTIEDVKKQNLSVATAISISNDKHSLILDAIEWAFQSSPRKPAYHPILFLPQQKIIKQDKLLLAFCGSALNLEQKTEPTIGKIIYGDQFSSLKIQLKSWIKAAGKVENEIGEMLETHTSPSLRLNDHCKICEFQEICYVTAKENDDLSLLSALSEKEIEKLHNKGIFTVRQYSYTFRPRRKRKGAKVYSRKHLAELQALSIQNNKIYVYERPQFPVTNTQIFFDVEGDPFKNYYYLIGVVIVENSIEKRYSFWADDEQSEDTIFMQFTHLLKNYADCFLYHYGSYETKYLRKMQKKLGGHKRKEIEGILNKSINVLSKIYGYVYFPTYSNKLKDIGAYLGFHWTEKNASGWQSVLWKNNWDKSHDGALKQQLIRYNIEDCLALKKITGVLSNISTNNNDENNDGKSPEYICEQKQQDEHDPRKWHNTVYCSPDLDYINRCAYFDYQKEKVYFRTSNTILQVVKNEIKQQKLSGRVNKCVKFMPPRKCSHCGNNTFHRGKHFSKKVFDLKIFQGGMKRWVTKYSGVDYRCTECHKYFSRKKRHGIKSKYGHSLVCWMVYQNIANGMSGGQIKRILDDAFELPLRADHLSNYLQPAMAAYYKKTYNHILRTILAGNLIFADETQINYRDGSGYVWVIVSMEETYYVFTETREGDFLIKLLKNFSGVLVSDFYAAYNSITCAQQKCLIHLIRDLNNDFFKNQLDEEFKTLLQLFTKLLRNIIDTIDKRGLKKWYLNKHREETKRFFAEICRQEYKSELAKSYQKRFTKNQGVLFTFLEYDGVPWNNNSAEHAIKAFADFRKRMGQSFTRRTLSEFLILLSVWQTCKSKGINFLKFLCSKQQHIDLYKNTS